MDAFKLIPLIAGLIGIVVAAYKFNQWAVPRVRRRLAARRLRRLLPEMQMQAMAERITALENQLAGQEDLMRSFVHDMFALDRANSKQLGGLLDLLRELEEGRIRANKYDSGFNERLFAVLQQLYDQIDHLWDAHLKALALIDVALKPTHERQDNPTPPELKSA